MRRMAMGKRKRDRQPPIWVTITDLPTAASHPFTTTASEITKGSGIGSSKAARCVDASEGFAGVSDLVAC
jgi:hypothetical protein